MEQRNEAASNHASLLTRSFLFRALARLQPPAGLIETAMERERGRKNTSYVTLGKLCYMDDNRRKHTSYVALGELCYMDDKI